MGWGSRLRTGGREPVQVDAVDTSRTVPADQRGTASRKERRAARKAELDRLTEQFLAEQRAQASTSAAVQETPAAPTVDSPEPPASSPVAEPAPARAMSRKERKEAEEAAFLAQYLDWTPDADSAVLGGPIDPSLLGGRFDYARGVAVGIVVGVVATLGAQFVMHQVSRISRGNDPLAYATVVNESQPVFGDDDAIRGRLDRATHTRWRLQPFYATKAKGPQSLAAQRSRIERRLTLPDARQYPLERVLTNAFAPKSPHGTIFVVWFVHAYEAGDWLRDNHHVVKGLPAGVTPLTMWSGDMVVYYVPGTTDDTATLKTWLQAVSSCSTSAC